MSASTSTQTAGVASPWPALWALVIGFFMILVDSTIVSVATPTLMDAFGAGVNEVLWVTSAYLLAYAWVLVRRPGWGILLSRATIVGDLSAPGVLPPDSFDCIVLTQTLHLIYDVRGAAAALHDALRPGGVLLLTVPGISQIDRHEWAGSWYWALTPLAASRLFAEVFGARAVRVEGHGNVFAATAFLQGVALEEVPRAKLAVQDPAYPVVVTVRARKPPAGGAGP